MERRIYDLTPGGPLDSEVQRIFYTVMVPLVKTSLLEEVSKGHSSEEVSVMEMERRTESNRGF